jgi:hypothetical protein
MIEVMNSFSPCSKAFILLQATVIAYRKALLLCKAGESCPLLIMLMPMHFKPVFSLLILCLHRS